MADYQTIKPIETRYKGYRFRSRLEARWAVFFDALGIEWEYEKEGYDLGDAGWYLPDFWLPCVEAYVEIKASSHAAQVDYQKYMSMSEKYNLIVTVALPNPGSGEIFREPHAILFAPSGRHAFRFAYADRVIGVCGTKNNGWSLWDGKSSFCIHKENKLDEVARTILMMLCENTRIIKAFRQANEARFEHGESPEV